MNTRRIFQAGAGAPEAEGDYSYTIPVIAIFVIFILGLAGSLIPPLFQIYFPTLKLIERNGFRLFNGMAAGLVLGVGYIHSLPDAVESFEEAFSNLDEQVAGYAWGGLFALLGSLVTFFGEEFVDRHLSLFGELHGHSHGGEHNGNHTHNNGEEMVKMKKKEEKKEEKKEMKRKLEDELATTEQEEPNGEEPTNEVVQKKVEVGYYKELYVLLFGLTFHSLFVGIALGVAGDDLSLFLAILFHQFFEGLALGARVARANFKSKAHVWLLDLLYAVSAPVGIAIGIGIESALEGSATAYNTVNGIFQGLSAGILIYVALIHMMKEELAREEYKKGGTIIYYLYFGFVLGAAAMAIIGIWA